VLATTGSSRTRRGDERLPADVAAAVRNAAASATARHRESLVEKLENAATAYDGNRFPEAARLAAQVADEAPGVAAVRELAGLAAYRCGRWRAAIRHLIAFGGMDDDVTYVPALMDCHRALGQAGRVAELWTGLRQHSPGADVLAEARIVAAGALADRGDLQGAIVLLATGGAAKSLRNPADRHVRQWYALADLYERSGDLPRARDLFTRVLRADPDAYDVAQRLEALGPERRAARRRPTRGTETARSRRSAAESSPST
jgi:tetratricopeptide (TPR) repeat protein